MIDEHTARALAAELDMPLELVRQTLAEAESKADTSNPVARAKSWLRGMKSRENAAPRVAARPELPYVGFDQYGATIRSATPVTNTVTEFANWIVREIRDQLLTPADVVRIVRKREASVYEAIGVHTLRHWATHMHWRLDESGTPVHCDRECDIACWASLHASSGLGEAIRSWGGWYPWSRDVNAWEVICARDQARRTPAA